MAGVNTSRHAPPSRGGTFNFVSDRFTIAWRSTLSRILRLCLINGHAQGQRPEDELRFPLTQPSRLNADSTLYLPTGDKLWFFSGSVPEFYTRKWFPAKSSRSIFTDILWFIPERREGLHDFSGSYFGIEKFFKFSYTSCYQQRPCRTLKCLLKGSTVNLLTYQTNVWHISWKEYILRNTRLTQIIVIFSSVFVDKQN